ASPELKAGHSKCNTENGKLNGKPSVRLEGRSTLGSLPLPAYTVNESGTVVVQIVVNEKGIVTNAIPGQKGTTTNNPTLWAEARKAALKARFSPSDAPTQVGYITYVFILK
ncbi:MAG: energy transducer TonB, partial [Bacteroidales bacterium]|nr:energy transducer TonB [Bacteroidales bacterium]